MKEMKRKIFPLTVFLFFAFAGDYIFSDPSGTISAFPNPCKVYPDLGETSCVSTISWSTTEVPQAKVFVRKDSPDSGRGKETEFAAGLSGKKDATIEWRGNVYWFILYYFSSDGRQGWVLASVRVIEGIPLTLYSPHLAVGNMGNGISWVTYLTFYNRSDRSDLAGWGTFTPKGDRLWFQTEYADGAKGFSFKISNFRSPVLPGGIERVALYPCIEKDKLPCCGVFEPGCQGDDRLQTGFMRFWGSATWDSILERYEPDMNVQVTFQAIKDGVPFSSLSFFATPVRPGGIIPVIEVSSTDKFSTGIAIAIVHGRKADIDLILRGPRSEELSRKKLIIDRGEGFNYGKSITNMFDELFPEFSGKLPLGTLEFYFTPDGDGRGTVMGIRVDYSNNGEARLANLMTFFK